ncbi:hypothetical protein M9H77_06943 [Catharanthus roseus]|uniref:Uncharacterized protein n=1 Tax=Catharanthus roseus TaxID=4058 RepID=A0ACC0BTS2_CATRO|nr:hypothetical protein M9H77_06943 [Catharanthus roseus]
MDAYFPRRHKRSFVSPQIEDNILLSVGRFPFVQALSLTFIIRKEYSTWIQELLRLAKGCLKMEDSQILLKRSKQHWRACGMTWDKHENMKIFQGPASRSSARKLEEENEEWWLFHHFSMFLRCLPKEDTINKGGKRLKMERKQRKMMPNGDHGEDLLPEVGQPITGSKCISNKGSKDRTLLATVGSSYFRR